jgi:hypothetical protein
MKMFWIFWMSMFAVLGLLNFFSHHWISFAANVLTVLFSIGIIRIIQNDFPEIPDKRKQGGLLILNNSYYFLFGEETNL